MRIAPFLCLGLAAFTSFGQTPCKSTLMGELRVAGMKSDIYGASITIRIWLPADYARNPDRRYPTLYMLDGQTLFDECTAFSGEHELRLDETVAGLVADGKIPPPIIVGIDSTSHRDYEYAPYNNPVTDADKPEQATTLVSRE